MKLHEWPIQARFWLEWGCFDLLKFCHPDRNRSTQSDDLWSGGTCCGDVNRAVWESGDRVGIDDTKERNTAGRLRRVRNVPTQAKTGLEWATRQLHSLRRLGKYRLEESLLGGGLPQFSVAIHVGREPTLQSFGVEDWAMSRVVVAHR